ncbi:hypothetical protein GVAV_003376 [Gurleya vavrai]
MSNDLKNQKIIIDKINGTILQNKFLLDFIISVSFNIEDIINVQNRLKKNKREGTSTMTDFNNNSKRLKISDEDINENNKQRNFQNFKNSKSNEKDAVECKSKNKGTQPLLETPINNQTDEIDITNDQKLIIYVNPLYDKEKYDEQEKLDTIKLTNPFINFKIIENPNTWLPECEIDEARLILKELKAHKNSITYNEIIILESKFIVEQNDFFISYYKKQYEKITCSINKAAKNIFNKSLLASKSFKQKFLNNNKIKTIINKEIFEICKIENTNLLPK